MKKFFDFLFRFLSRFLKYFFKTKKIKKNFFQNSSIVFKQEKIEKINHNWIIEIDEQNKLVHLILEKTFNNDLPLRKIHYKSLNFNDFLEFTITSEFKFWRKNWKNSCDIVEYQLEKIKELEIFRNNLIELLNYVLPLQNQSWNKKYKLTLVHFLKSSIDYIENPYIFWNKFKLSEKDIELKDNITKKLYEAKNKNSVFKI